MEIDYQVTTGFQVYIDRLALGSVRPDIQTAPSQVDVLKRSMTYRFTAHFHPYVRELVDELVEHGIQGLLAKDTEYWDASKKIHIEPGKPGDGITPTLSRDIFLTDAETIPVGQYAPTEMVLTPYPRKELDFSIDGAYGVYNWELFFHVPLAVAIHLSRNQRFEEAMRWFHFLFDPTDDNAGASPARFWKVRPFQTADIAPIEAILINLSADQDPDNQTYARRVHDETVNAISAWKDSPFRPHLVARYRHSAYMLKTVMAYLDNLIAWGDNLFRQDTGESIGEATQLYVTALNVLGPRPQLVPTKGTLQTQTYAKLRPDLDEFSNALRELETTIPFDIVPLPSKTGSGEQLAALRSVGGTLFFRVPRNENLLAYWDTVADRLFKIRNSLNIQGIFRQLPLFEPPIDPALLARAAAAGLDIGAVVAAANQPLPLVRYQVLAQRAAEICQEVKALGAGLLSALEKEDNEALAILRAKHERVILDLAESVRYGQWQEAIKNREAAQHAITNAAHRYTYYERLLGRPENEITLPELDELDADGLINLKLRASEPEIPLRALAVDIASDLGSEAGGRKLSTEEVQELKQLKSARDKQEEAGIQEKLGAALAVVPDPEVNLEYWGIGGTLTVSLSKAMTFWAMFARSEADHLTYLAGNTAKLGSYSRRELEWGYQSNLAADEVTHLYKQLRAAQIREALAERELSNHRQQMRHAEEIETFLADEKKGKRSNVALYAWMKREIRGLYSQCFQFAFDVAKKAERALQYELGDPNLTYLQFGYAGGKEGLLAGEKLYFDLKRMEIAYHDQNQRELELTKHVSLQQLDPTALLQLKESGRCQVSLPEELFDIGGAGHYFRRIKSVALSIPCVVGPYTSVNCTLTLLKSTVRTKAQLQDGDKGPYERGDANDLRFVDRTGSIQSIVTSSGQNDSGLFEVNLRDERYLPFEGAGVVSDWQLTLPTGIREFDYNTISDVIMHVRYTARQGGEQLANAALASLSTRVTNATAGGTTRLFSVRHEFPSEWSNFKRSEAGESVPLTLTLKPEHYPFWAQNMLNTTARVDLYARGVKSNFTAALTDVAVDPLEFEKDPRFGTLLVSSISSEETPLPPPTGTFSFSFADSSPTDLWAAVTWSA